MYIAVCVFSSVHDALDQRIFHKECQSLVRAGYSVSLIARHPRSEVLDGVRIIPLAHTRHRVSRIFKTGWQIYRKALAEKAAIYHFHDPELIGVGLLLRLHGRKVVYDVHEDVPQDLLHKFYVPKWMRYPMSWFVRAIEAVAARFLSAVVVVTPSISERFAKHSKNVVLVRNFAVLEEFASAETRWDQRDPAVIFLGSMSRNRGIRELVEAIDLVPSSLNPTLRLLGPFSIPNFQAELGSLPGWTRTEVLGVTQERRCIRGALSHVSAGMLTLNPIPQLMVSYPIKLFEYMAAGIPIIASDFPVWRRFIEDSRCGVLVNPLKTSEIAAAIEYILSHPAEAERMGKNGRRAMESQFNWAHEERALLRLYSELCPRSRRVAQPVAESGSPQS